MNEEEQVMNEQQEADLVERALSNACLDLVEGFEPSIKIVLVDQLLRVRMQRIDDARGVA